MLQGSLENFALDEVLGLLSSTKKTGKLEITGDRGTGGLLFSDGLLVGAEANHTPNGDATEDIMFELLRFSEGTFTFSSEEVTSIEDERDLTSVLIAAENRLKDWRDIERIVPSLSHIVTPIPELPDDKVTINRSEWAALNVIAAGCPVSLVCEELNLGEVEGSRRIKELAERSLVVIGGPLGSSSYGTSATAADSISNAAPPTPEDVVFEGDDLAGGDYPSLSGSDYATSDYASVASSYSQDDAYQDTEASVSDKLASLEGFDVAAPPSLATPGDWVENGSGDDSKASKNGMLRRYLSSED